MPYIRQIDRCRLDNKMKALLSVAGDLSAGELNYVITTLIDANVRVPRRYDNINRAIGVLTCVQLEYYRRIAAPYEDKKCAENGDVYEAD